MIVDNIIEEYRKISIKACFSLQAFSNSFQAWKNEIHRITGQNFNPISLLSIGDHLSSIFQTTGTSGRGQSSVSAGGYGWEGLVCWYLNLCMAGSRAVAIKKVSDLPEPLRDAIAINYGTFRSNTEADITVVIFPNLSDFTSAKLSISITDSSGSPLPLTSRRGNFNLNTIGSRLAEIHFNQFEVGIIQCKTNWNDNAQIPMLWSMIYQAQGFSNNSISIGNNSYSIQQIPFTYSFCTVPSNNLSTYSNTSTAVQRVRNLSGGNYWGHPTSNGISSSIKEIFNRNFSNAFTPHQRANIEGIIPDLENSLSYFDII